MYFSCANRDQATRNAGSLYGLKYFIFPGDLARSAVLLQGEASRVGLEHSCLQGMVGSELLSLVTILRGSTAGVLCTAENHCCPAAP